MCEDYIIEFEKHHMCVALAPHEICRGTGWNQSHRPQQQHQARFSSPYGSYGQVRNVPITTKTGMGWAELEKSLLRYVMAGSPASLLLSSLKSIIPIAWTSSSTLTGINNQDVVGRWWWFSGFSVLVWSFIAWHYFEGEVENRRGMHAVFICATSATV